MKLPQILSCLLVVVFSSTIVHSADTLPALRVESSSTMKVAIINADQRNPANERMHKAFVASLAFQISQGYKTPIPLKAIVVEAKEASAGLTSGEYDLVAVIGTSTPAILLNSDFKRLKALPSTGNTKHVVTLLVRNDDCTLSAMLDKSFETALNETIFQMAFANYRKASVDREKTEWKVAVASLQ